MDQFSIALESMAKDIEAALVVGVQRPHQVFDQNARRVALVNVG